MKQAVWALAFFACACAQVELKPPASVEFDLLGRIAARYAKDAFTGNLNWRHAGSGDELLKRKAEAIVTELGRCQKANGGGWLSAFPTEFMQRLEERLPVWAPFYTLHKILAGLLDMHEHCGDAQALDVALGLVAWTQKWASGIGDEK